VLDVRTLRISSSFTGFSTRSPSGTSTFSTCVHHRHL
jgi:hypothetical protein